MGTSVFTTSGNTEIVMESSEEEPERSSVTTSKIKILTAMRPLGHLIVAIFLKILALTIMLPALVDVTIESLCPKHNRCSEAIYISGVQQSVSGFGTIISTPLVGQLSDEYGRKPLLLVSFALSIIPFAVLACGRTKGMVYTYYVLRTLVAIATEGAIICVSMAYVADVMEENLRANAFGILTGILAIAFVIGTVLARVLSVSYIFQVGCILLVAAVLYVQLFLKEPHTTHLESSKHIKKINTIDRCSLPSSSTLTDRWSSVKETLHIVRMSKNLTNICIITFFFTLGASGVASVILYYFKATYNFNKNEFAYLMLIFGVGTILVQLVFLPLLSHLFGEQKILCVALFSGVAMQLLLSVSSSPWIPYLCAFLGALSILIFPCASSIVSKSSGPHQQGKVQGFVSGIGSCASTLSPLAMSPLTALFLSEDAPFDFPGFSMICAALAMMVAFIQSCFMNPPLPAMARFKVSGYVEIKEKEDADISICSTDYFVS
eukprot:c25887_g1_i2 orf=521-1996(+)